MAAASCSFPNLPRISEMPDRLELFRSGRSVDPRGGDVWDSLILRSARGPADAACCEVASGRLLREQDGARAIAISPSPSSPSPPPLSPLPSPSSLPSPPPPPSSPSFPRRISNALSSARIPVSRHLYSQSHETIQQLPETEAAANRSSFAGSNGLPGGVQCTRCVGGVP